MSRKRVKQYLTLLVAIGVLAIALSGGGTFASFTAETANPGNTFATGTLYLHDSVNGNTECTSESTTNNSNVPANVGQVNPGDHCDFLFTVPSSQFAPNAQVNTAGATGTITSIPVKGWDGLTAPGNIGLAFPIADGAEVQITQGGNTDICQDNGGQAAGATSIAVHSCVLGSSYTAGAIVSTPGPFIAHLTLRNAGTIDGSDLQMQLNGNGCQYNGVTLSGGTAYTADGAVYAGTASPGDTTIHVGAGGLTHAIPSGANVQITDGTNTEVVQTTASASASATSISVTALTNSYANPYTVKSLYTTSLAVHALTFAIPSGTTLAVNNGSTYDYVTTSADAAAGDTSISITGHTMLVPYANTNPVGTYLTSGACNDLGFQVVETNNHFASTINQTTGNITGASGCAYGTSNGSGCNVNVGSFNLAGVDTRAASLFNTLALSSGGGTDNSRNLTGVDSTINHATGSGYTQTGAGSQPGGARYFLVEIWPGSLTNSDMGASLTFDLVWHMDQS